MEGKIIVSFFREQPDPCSCSSSDLGGGYPVLSVDLTPDNDPLLPSDYSKRNQQIFLTDNF